MQVTQELRKWQNFSENTFFPEFGELSIHLVKNCSSWVQTKPVKHAKLKPPLLYLATTDKYFPGEMLRIDLAGKLPETGGYTHILTAKDTFNKFLFATPLRNANAPNVAKQLFHTLMRASYLPKIVFSDMGTAFTYRVIIEISC